MITYMALLRGINVGGHKKTPMAELRSLLEDNGFDDVKTYIQSGNVVFRSFIKDKAEIKALIKKAILDYFGFEVPTLVKTPTEIETILKACPFSEEKMEKSYFIMLDSEPEGAIVTEIQKLSSDDEEFVIAPNSIYIFYRLGAGKAKLGVNWFEKKLKVKATARNYRTMTKLLDMATNQ